MGLSSMRCVLCSKTPLQVWLDGQLACLWGSAVWQRDFCLASRSGFWKLERQVTDVSNQKLMLEETSSTKSGRKREDERKESPERQPGNPMEGCRAAKRQRPGLWTQDQAPSTSKPSVDYFARCDSCLRGHYLPGTEKIPVWREAKFSPEKKNKETSINCWLFQSVEQKQQPQVDVANCRL